MNRVFIATSIDGFIADTEGGIEWLEMIPNPMGDDMGYSGLMKNTDALVMGRTTFEKVLSFGIPWPYEKPVFVLSRSMRTIPEELEGKVEILAGKPNEILKEIKSLGFQNLYIDGGKVVQEFLQADLIDELTITVIPVVLGAGIPLFGKQPDSLEFSLTESKVFLGQLVQTTFSRTRNI